MSDAGVDEITINSIIHASACILIFIMVAGLIKLAASGWYYEKTNPWDGCELIKSIKTEDREYCGKACSIPVFADTYQCGGEQKTWLNARWSMK